MIAARSEDGMALEMLLEKGADYTLKNKANQLFYDLIRDDYLKRQMMQYVRLMDKKKQSLITNQFPQQNLLPSGPNELTKEEAIPFYRPQKSIWKFFKSIVHQKIKKTAVIYSEKQPMLY